VHLAGISGGQATTDSLFGQHRAQPGAHAPCLEA